MFTSRNASRESFTRPRGRDRLIFGEMEAASSDDPDNGDEYHGQTCLQLIALRGMFRNNLLLLLALCARIVLQRRRIYGACWSKDAQ